MKKPFPITGLSFVYNNSSCIEGALEQLAPALEKLVIFDQSSTDDTTQIITRVNAKYKNIMVGVFPWMLCGDGYKPALLACARTPWVLWWYPDERWPEATLEIIGAMTQQTRWDCIKFQRHEYMDNVELPFHIIAPNYQNRLHRVRPDIFYTDLVHAEVHGRHVDYALGGQYYMEHRKTSADQERSNIRLYVSYNELIFRYGETQVQEYKAYIDSYKKIIHDSQAKNLSGERKIHLAEEFWPVWWKYAKHERITLEQFKEIVGMSYEDFLKQQKSDAPHVIAVPDGIVDEILTREKSNERQGL